MLTAVMMRQIAPSGLGSMGVLAGRAGSVPRRPPPSTVASSTAVAVGQLGLGAAEQRGDRGLSISLDRDRTAGQIELTSRPATVGRSAMVPESPGAAVA